jgi:hypothetical protein
MKFKIEKGIKVLTHHECAPWHIRTDFIPITTDVKVTFDMGDLWFAPKDKKFNGSGTKDLHAANIKDLPWYRHVIDNFYGFNLPSNARHIDCIIVERQYVKVIQSEDKSHIRKEQQMLRRMNQPAGGYILPGHLPK